MLTTRYFKYFNILPLLVPKRGIFAASSVAAGGSDPAGEESSGGHDLGSSGEGGIPLGCSGWI
jgi:hypothetical protein